MPRGAVSVDFATDAEGRITWVDGPLASALVGFSLSGAADRDGEEADAAAPPPLVSQLRARQPLRAAPLAFEGAPAISGEWLADAVARFDPVSGRFTGYCGRLRRPLRIAPVAAQPSADQAAADNMRQILHELKNPANAIQVAAEIIQQQLYGPAPHEYRALAAAIAGDVAQILAGFDELDRLVKLESGVMAPRRGRMRPGADPDPDRQPPAGVDRAAPQRLRPAGPGRIAADPARLPGSRTDDLAASGRAGGIDRAG
ncbi:hypothetical protein ACFSTD_07285 [Novosphingobium colocasiae]